MQGEMGQDDDDLIVRNAVQGVALAIGGFFRLFVSSAEQVLQFLQGGLTLAFPPGSLVCGDQLVPLPAVFLWNNVTETSGLELSESPDFRIFRRKAVPARSNRPPASRSQ